MNQEAARRLGCLLRNESDMAFKRRVPILMEYLELREGDHILDCGCGMGFYLKALRVLGEYILLGLDSDSRPLHFARQALKDGGALVQGDVLALPYADKSCDKVIMAEVLEHLGDDHQGAREVWRVLRAGGILALSVPHSDYPFCWDPINHTLERLSRRPVRSGPLAGIWANHYRLYRPAELIEVLRETGFSVEDAQERRQVPDAERFVAYLDKPWSALEPYLDNLTNGTMDYEGSLIEAGLTHFKRGEAVELLEQAKEPFLEALERYREGDKVKACELVVRASALWTHATWKEFLEEDVIGSRVPEAYRPIEEEE